MFFPKIALLSLGLLGAARAADDIDLLVWVAVDGGKFAPAPADFAVSNIPCGGSKSVSFRIDYKGDRFDIPETMAPGTTIRYELIDVEEGVKPEDDDNDDWWKGSVLDKLKTTIGEDGSTQDVDATFVFHCTEEILGDPTSCRLDYDGGVVETIDGEKSSYAEFHVKYKVGDEVDYETQRFEVGCKRNRIVDADPHFKTWEGEWYDYMGECDVKFVDAPAFAPGMPMQIQLRTKARYDYSYVESAAIQIGEEIFEVGSWGEYFLNGVESAALPNTISGFKITKEVESDKVTKYFIHMDDEVDGEKIEFKTFKDWVGVSLINANHARYHGATGMLGSHDAHGKLLGRDDFTVFTDMNAFGQEWQVQPDEPMLFHSIRMPQAPAKCILPSEVEAPQRRLGEQIGRQDALKACEQAGWNLGTIEMCVHDVMATGDLEVASAGAM